MSLFNTLGTTEQQQGQLSQADMQKDLNNIKSNPFSYLKGKGYNIPNNMTDVRQITQYLLQTGQVGNARLQQVMRMIGYR